jgi:hypothetical protein
MESSDLPAAKFLAAGGTPAQFYAFTQRYEDFIKVMTLVGEDRHPMVIDPDGEMPPAAEAVLKEWTDGVEMRGRGQGPTAD